MVTDDLFNCGPRPQNYPSREELVEFSSADVLSLADSYWFWGMRCEQQLDMVHRYINCNKGDKEDCKTLESDVKKMSSDAKDNKLVDRLISVTE